MFNKAIIAGIGETPIGKLPDHSVLGLYALAAKAAIEDAGIDWSHVDGLITCGSLVDHYPRHALVVAEYLGICEQMKYVETPQLSGVSPFAGLVNAFRLVEEGTCQAVLVIATDKPRTGQSRNDSVNAFARMRHPEYEQPYGLTNVTAYALLAQYHMERYGTTPEQLASVAVTFREHAMKHPKAVYRDPMTIQDVLASRVVSSPLHLYECSPITDGGGAILVTREGMNGSGKKPIKLQGYGFGFTHDHLVQMGELDQTGCKLSSRRAFEMAGVTWVDVDVAMLYDSYTITVLLELENMGICEPGTSGEFVAQGNLKVGGRLPTNPHGGLLSHAHCGLAAGIFHITEAIKQLRGEAENQIEDARLALLHGEGGILSANCTMLLSRD